jgi:hypothetical protein
MSFTEDELQSFNTILEQRLQAHLRDMERALDQRMLEYRRELDRRLETVHVEVKRSFSQQLSEFQVRIETSLIEKLSTYSGQFMKAYSREIEKRQQQFEGNIDRMLAAQLLGIEQLFAQYAPQHDSGETIISENAPEQIDAIEVQTELVWEDLMVIIGKALDDRLSVVNSTIQKSLKNLENYLSVHLQSLSEELSHEKPNGYHSILDGDTTNMQEILHGIEQLEQVIESMQVVMTSNHALLLNRLHHHQQLPFERAHAAYDQSGQLSNGLKKQFALSEEHVFNDVEPEGIIGQTQIGE